MVVVIIHQAMIRLHTFPMSISNMKVVLTVLPMRISSNSSMNSNNNITKRRVTRKVKITRCNMREKKEVTVYPRSLSAPELQESKQKTMLSCWQTESHCLKWRSKRLVKHSLLLWHISKLSNLSL